MDNFEPIGLSEFFGGMSTDLSLGAKGQFYYGQHLDFRKNPSSLSILPATTNADGGVVVDLVQDMEQINSGVRYALGDAGYWYKIATSGVWSTLGQIGEVGGAGLVYRADVDHLYATGQTKISRIPRVSAGNAPQMNWFANGVSTCTTCSMVGGANTYTTPTAIDETNPINRRSFTSDIEPLYQIGVKIVATGTGNVTLTLHDDANTSLGAVTITNANLKVGKINYFVFSTPIRIQRGDNGGGSALTYHFHLTSTVADTTIATMTANSMADCDMELWATALVPARNNLHPMINFSNFTLIGNGNYVAVYEPLQDNPTTADFERHRLTLPTGYEVCGFAQKNLMCVIGCEKRSTTGEFQDGLLLFWDGVADTYNDFWSVPEGSPESLFSHRNVVYFVAGGVLFEMRGGDEPIPKRTFRNTDSEYSGVTDVTHVYPNMMTVRRGILLVGYPSYTTNVNLEHGVYSYGTITSEYPQSFGYSYTTSNGNILNNGTNNLKIGFVKSYGDTLYMSWRDDSASPQKYSVDIVNNSSPVAATASIESLEFDDNRRWGYKKAGYMIVTFDPLPVGISITPKWKLDGGSWTTNGTTDQNNNSQNITNPTYALVSIDTPTQYQFSQFGIDIANTTQGTVSPNITGVYLFTDPQSTAATQQRPIGVA